MKKAFLISLFLVCASLSSFAQTSIQGRVYNVRAYGAKGDNSTNDTAAFTAAVAALNASGGTLKVPAGTYPVDAAVLTIITNGVTIEGDGPNVTVIKSRTNTAGLVVLNTASSSLHTVTIKDLTLEGFGSGASNNGITVSGANTPFNIRFSNIRILNFTGRGIYDTAGMFQSRLDNVVVSQAATGNNAIDVLGSNDLLIQNCYVTVTGNNTAAYRIHSGRPTLISNNGINPGSTSASWAVFGDELSQDGADRYVFAVMIGNNLEDFTDNGVRFKAGSYGSFFGNSFIAPSSGTVTPLKFDFVDNGQRGLWDATNSIQTTGASYTNGNAINSSGAPFTQVGGTAFTSYYDTSIASSITFPYLTPQLVPGSSNIALLTTRAQITTLESSGLAGDLTGNTDFAGNASRILLQDGTAARPTYTFSGDTNTGFYRAGADSIGVAANGASVGSFGTTGLTLGIPSSATGATIFANSSNANTTTLQPGAPASSISITLPATLPASAGCLQISSTGVITQTGSACGAGGGSVSWDAITNPVGNQALSMAAFTTAWTWNAATGASNLFTLTDTASNTGTGYIASIGTAASSSAKPIRITAGGTTNGVEMTTAGALAAIGTGSITANTGDSATSFFTSGQIEASRGGTGQDTSAATGMPLITSGTWSVISTTGTGNAVRATSPTLTTPNLGAATATTINGLAITSSTGTLTIANGKTVTASNTLTFNGTDGTSVAFGAGGTVAYVGLANSWSAGIKQTFAPNGTTAGLNVGSVAGDPSTPANGDLWYDSTANELTARINGANVALGSGGASGANPTATIGLTTVNGVATTFMRSDAAPALSQAIAPTWTGLHTYNPGTTPSDVLLFDIAAIGSAGTRDSHNFVMRGRSDNGSAHTVEWKQFIDVTSNAGASQWVLQSNLDGGSFSNWLTVKDDGEVLLGNITGSSATFGANVAADTLSATTSLTVTGTSTMREIDPEADNTYDLGTTSLRWKTVHVGPGSLVVHNDSTNTLKATLGFSGSTAQLTTDSATPLQLRTGSNNGLFLNTNGTIGFNLTSAPNGNVDLRQIANGDQILNLRRATDTSPTGNFINFENAAGTDLFTVDIAGSLSAGSVPTGRLTGTLAAGQFPALTGDVTTTAGSVATTIANDAVTFAKMQNVSAASKLLGRGDSGSGDVQEITIGSGLAMTGTTLSATGGGSGNVTTAGGTSGRYTKFTSGVNIENALLSESGNDISGTATLTLTNPSTSSRLLVGRSITSQSADMFALFSTSDANPRVAVDSSFRLQFGPGGATSVDTNLYRSAAATLRTDGGFVAGTSGTFVIASNGNITSIRGVATNFPASNSAGVLTNDGSGNFSWVASSNPFTASAGIIDFTTSTDWLRLVAGSTSTTPLEVDGVPSQTANLIQVKATSGAANPILAVDSSGRLQFGAGGGTAVDTNLYRNSANALKTDDSFTAAGGLTSENNIGVTGTSLRFTADFSNATLTNRFMFQSNTTNGSTFVSTLPNGLDTFSGFVAYNSSSPTSAHYVRMFLNSTTSALIDSGKNGGGAVAPLGFAHNAAQIATFTTGGHFTVGAAGTTDAAFLTVAGGISTATTTVSANTTLNDTHSSILCNASGAVRTMTLPAASGLTGRAYTIKKTDSSANACIIDANASETIDGSLTISLTGQYDSVTIQTDGTNWFRVGQQLAAAEAGYISGLVLEWVSTTQVRVTSGSAQLQSTGQMLVAPSSLTISPTLAANTWYHCYVFESSGVAALECVTTAPASAWVGTARSKTSDTARRYVGSIRTNASSQIFNFLVEGAGDLQIVRWRNDVTNDNRILTNGSATTNTNVDASSRAPVTSRAIEVTIYNLATGGVVYFDTSDAGSAGTGLDPGSAIGLFALNPNAINTTYLPLNTSQVFRYSYNGSPTGSNFTYIDLLSFRIGR